MGAIEITSFIFHLNNSIWSIELKFNFFPVGYIRFECDNFKFNIVKINETDLKVDAV